MTMAVLPDAVVAFHGSLERAEADPERRERLFLPFWAPRSAVIKRVTRAVIRFALGEGAAMKNAAVLDYGCGVKPYAGVFERLGARVTGADFDGNARRDITLTDDGRVPAEDGHYNYVFSIQVLEHVPVPSDYLREAWRILKPDGKLFLTTHGVWPHHPTPGDYHRWTRSGLEEELRRGGFDPLEIRPILNEYSAAVQFFAVNGEHHGAWRGARPVVHALAYGLIWCLERLGRCPPETPAILCALARKGCGLRNDAGHDR